MSTIGCVSVTGCRASLPLLERLSYLQVSLAERLPSLRARSGADEIAVLSTCERTEVYAVWDGAPDLAALVGALAADRGVPRAEVVTAATELFAGDAVRHLFRVASGLESFVVGETDIVGQVRAAAEAGRAAGTVGLVLDRLMGAAVSASRQAHRRTTFAESGRSVGTAAVDAVTAMRGGLAGCRLLVVGAGQMAASVVEKAGPLGASVTVCNRTRRRAERFVAAGATVVDLADLGRCLAEADVVVVSTAAPHPVVDARSVEQAMAGSPRRLLVVDLCLPRNVEQSVRQLPGVDLVDLVDLRQTTSGAVSALADDAATASSVVDEEVARFTSWLGTRPAVEAVRRLRADSEQVARQELERMCRELPEEVYAVVERGLIRAVRRLTHGPTRELRTAAEAGDGRLVALLAGMFAPSERA